MEPRSPEENVLGSDKERVTATSDRTGIANSSEPDSARICLKRTASSTSFIEFGGPSSFPNCIIRKRPRRFSRQGISLFCSYFYGNNIKHYLLKYASL